MTGNEKAMSVLDGLKRFRREEARLKKTIEGVYPVGQKVRVWQIEREIVGTVTGYTAPPDGGLVLEFSEEDMAIIGECWRVRQERGAYMPWSLILGPT